MAQDTWLPESVIADHRSIAVHYPGKRVVGVMDLATLTRVSLINHKLTLYWQLDGRDHDVLLVPFGIDGEAHMRRELQDLPGFDTHLLFSFLDDRADQEPPLTLWQA